MTGRTRRAVAVAVVVAALAGCSGGAEDDGDGAPTAGASGTTADELTPTEQAAPDQLPTPPPASFTRVEGDGFTIAAPAEFQQRRTTSANGEPFLVLEAPSSVPAVPQRVAVLRDVDPEADVLEQMYVLQASKSVGGTGTPVTRTQLPAPEGETAVLVTWEEVLAGGDGGSTEVTYWQLAHQVSDDLILNVVAFAPSSEFATSEVATILRSFEVDTTASG